VVVRYVLVALAALFVVSASAFVVPPPSGSDLRPVPFDDTVRLGLTGVDVRQAAEAGTEIPRVEVFFETYRYAVGYYTVEEAASALADPVTTRQFGRPLGVFVSDFAGTDPRVAEGGGIVVSQGAYVGWTAASDAVFVVGSAARTPAGPAVVPFGERADARAFARAYGGEVVDWPTARARLAARDGADRGSARARDAVAARHRWADATVADARALLDRPTSVVVGRDAPTLVAAVAAAPPNTTIRLPPGEYRVENLTVSKPLTIRGAGTGGSAAADEGGADSDAPATVLRGDGTGTVLQLRSAGIAVADLRVAGVGPNGTAPEAARNATGWDAPVRAAYGYGDAGLTFARSNGSLVRNVAVDTPANGVLVRDSADVVVERLRVTGSEEWTEGFMGVLAMRSRLVVQDSAVVGGRDGVYTHRAHGLVVRNNSMRGLRFGVHEMYTSDALVANNTVRDASTAGLIVMTRPAGNALVGNDVRDSRIGISATGSAAYVAGNVLAGNEYGLYVNGKRSLYARNAIAGNAVGVRAQTILPTNRVVGNDVVDNGEQVAVGGGPLRVWTVDGRGNYWGPLPILDRDGDGILDRAYAPTGPVDGALHRSPAAATLAASPAAELLRALQASVPGLRRAGVVDTAPLASPVRPAVLDGIDAGAAGGAGGAPDPGPAGSPPNATATTPDGGVGA